MLGRVSVLFVLGGSDQVSSCRHGTDTIEPFERASSIIGRQFSHTVLYTRCATKRNHFRPPTGVSYVGPTAQLRPNPILWNTNPTDRAVSDSAGSHVKVFCPVGLYVVCGPFVELRTGAYSSLNSAGGRLR